MNDRPAEAAPVEQGRARRTPRRATPAPKRAKAPEVEPARRRDRGQEPPGPRSWWNWALPFAGIALALGIPALVYYAWGAILESTDGQIEEVVTDPGAPGFETLVTTTPSHLMLGTDETGQLSFVAVIGLALNDEGGTVLIVPPESLVAGSRLLDTHGAGGPEATRAAVASLIDANVDSMITLDNATWAALTAPVAPLSIELNESLDLAGASGPDVVFPAGVTELQAADVGRVMAWVNPGESRFNRTARQTKVLTAWVEAVSTASAPDAVPAEIASGVGRMIRGLASGLTLYRETPVEPATTEAGEPAFVVDQSEVDRIVATMLPFPLPSEIGARLQIRLLDGVGGLSVATTFSPPLVAAGAQIVKVGNASEFGVTQTRVVYHDEALADRAQQLAAALDGALLEFDPITDAVVDATVVIGSDQLN